MGKASRGNGHQTARRPVDLTGIISPAEKNDFITLVNAITENMHRDLSNMFDSPPVRPIRGEIEQHHWLSLPLLRRRGSNKENVLALDAFRNNSHGLSTTTYKKAHQIIEKEENEAMTPQLRELKKEALAYLRKWQSSVLQRLREINVNDSIPHVSGSRTRGRGGARGGYRAGRGGRGGRGGIMASTLATGKMRFVFLSSISIMTMLKTWLPTLHFPCITFCPLPRPLTRYGQKDHREHLQIISILTWRPDIHQLQTQCGPFLWKDENSFCISPC